ncbi:YbhB/YbcL family Raf kinase inhibitor-like protein [Methylobacter psychrophilus]|uniref:YbhB/YbcL family Raf kinase inhibitor-like protein n=1 Tax=Methylobacter psychrophilus TaxID=96941 RepID=UPI0021D50FEF|nr:YbhB/YbcL family Raf kinase inhibitor-like protein [Methylobacter psychrophilus]
MNLIYQHPVIRLICLLVGIFTMTPALAIEGEQNMTLQLVSPDFVHRGEIPKTFTCEGDNSSPTLSWSQLPKNTQSLVLIVDDPDAPDPAAPKMTWVHWLLYNIPPTVRELPQAITESDLPAGIQQGKNDWKKTGYGGPCPPVGRHRYFHKLYALDIELPDLHHPDKTQLEKAMTGHIIDQAELIGTYQKQ